MATKKINLAALSLAFIFAACGDEITTEKITQVSQEGVAVVADVSQLPDCSSETEGRQALVKGEPSLRICVDGKWFVTYSDYVNMLDDFKCTAEKLQDDIGLKILCNGDSVGVVLNGSSGSNGLNGKSAYEIAVAGGYKGTEAQWLASLKGTDGENGSNGLNGKSAYEIAVAGGYKGTEAQWLASLKGDDGANGSNGLNGKSAYEIAVSGGYTKSETEWLASLKGDKGDSGEGCSINREESFITITCGNQNAIINVNEIIVTSNLGTCSKDNENKIGIYEGAYYACHSESWKNASDEEILNYNLGTCFDAKENMIGVYKNAYYACHSDIWVDASDEEILNFNLGTCSSVNENNVGKYENIYYICHSNKWEETSVEAVFGTCSDINENEIDNYEDSYYICHSNKWIEASIGICSSDYEKNVHKYENTYYICKSNKWAKASVLEYDTYGLSCVDNGSIINGNIISANKYVCDNGSFRNAEELEILLGESCSGFTMWKTIRKDYTETQDSIYYCSETNWEASVDRHYDVFTDSRDNKTYKMVTIGNQTWMVENLNYAYNVNSAKSLCYNDSVAYCNKNGRLYTWSAAMDSAGVFSDDGKDCGYHKTCEAIAQSIYPIRGVCPEGWHLPDTTDWNELLYTVRNKISAGLILIDDFAAYFNISDETFWTPYTAYLTSYYSTERAYVLFTVNLLNSISPEVTWKVGYNGRTRGFATYVRCVKDSEE